MAKKEGNYEVMYIINATLSDEDIAAVVARFKTMVEEAGTLTSLEEMGKRRLAYTINDMVEGYYVLMQFTSEPAFPAELTRVLGITDSVIRSLITTVGE